MSTAVTEAPSAARRARALRVRGLYAVTPDTADTAWLAAAAAAAIDGGAAVIQYRNKAAGAALAREQAVALARVCAGRGALLIVNDHTRLAAQVGADGVHLGEDDGEVAAARRVLGPDALIGVSCYNELARARSAVAAGADYVAFGSFFASGVKPHARRADAALLERAQELGVPVVAIGGITAGNAATLVRAGAQALAVITAVFGAPDAAGVTAAARALCAAIDRSRC
jgi:thiamine-phosphate pyrophosphorylase